MAKSSGSDWNYNDFNVKQPLRSDDHLSTPDNEQLSSPQSEENNLPERTATPRINKKIIVEIAQSWKPSCSLSLQPS